MVIIRLQNLSVLAETRDVREFFKGLCIPNGGVHIIGGEARDVFITFTSDEDACLAMRKDNCNLLGSRVKLYLSSHTEMQYVLKQTEAQIPEVYPQISPVERSGRSLLPDRTGYDDYCRGLDSVGGVSYSFNRSPKPRLDCRPFVGKRSRSPEKSMSSKRLPRSPQRYASSNMRLTSSPEMYSENRSSLSSLPIGKSLPLATTNPGNSREWLSLDRQMQNKTQFQEKDKFHDTHYPSRIESYPPRYRHSQSPTLRSTSPTEGHLSPGQFSRSSECSTSPERYLMTSTSPRSVSVSPRSSPLRSPMIPSRSSERPYGSLQRMRRSPGHRMYISTSGLQGTETSQHRQYFPYGDSLFLDKRDTGLVELGNNLGVEGFSENYSNCQINKLLRKEEQDLQEERIFRVLNSGLCSDDERKDIYPYSRNVDDSISNQRVGARGEQLATMMFPDTRGNNIPRFHEESITSDRQLEGFSMQSPNALHNKSYNNHGLYVPSCYKHIHNIAASHMNKSKSFTPNVNHSVSSLSHARQMKDKPSLEYKAAFPATSHNIHRFPFEEVPPESIRLESNTPTKDLVVSISGLKQEWDCVEIQKMLKGIFLPQENIQFDNTGTTRKFRTAFVKLCNGDDFKSLLSCNSYYYRKKFIEVSVCSDDVISRYFAPEILNRGNYYCFLTGAPGNVTYDDVLNFFCGLQVTDLYIKRAKKVKFQSVVFIAFGNVSDFQKALLKDGCLLGGKNRIQISRTFKSRMLNMKQRMDDLLSQSKVLIPAIDIRRALNLESFPEKPLCLLLTGLPLDINVKKILTFFKKTGGRPGKVRITLHPNGRPDGRAFVEFHTVNDFKSACKLKGSRMGVNIIFLEHILYDDMLKILKSVETLNNADKQTRAPSRWKVHQEMEPSHRLRNFQSLAVDDFKRTQNNRECSSIRSNFQVFELQKSNTVRGSTSEQYC